MSPEPTPSEIADVPQVWTTAGSQYVHDAGWVVKFRQDTLVDPAEPGRTFTRMVVEDPGAVVILAIDDEDRVVVLRQYRHPVGLRMIQLPAGKLDEPGEDPLDAAKRELREEAGLAAASWTHLLTTYASPGITSETHALYLARDLTEVPRDFEAHHEEADMTLERVAYADLLDAVLAGSAADGPLAAALLATEVLRARGALAES